MATMTIGMLSMMTQETEQEPVFMGPTLDDVDLRHLPDSEDIKKLTADVVRATDALTESMKSAEKNLSKMENWIAKSKASGDPILEAENHLRNIKTVIFSIQVDLNTMARALATFQKCYGTVDKSVKLVEHALKFTSKANQEELERIKYS